MHLPRFRLLSSVILVVAVFLVAELLVVFLVRLIIELTVDIKSTGMDPPRSQETGSVAGLTLSRLGGG